MKKFRTSLSAIAFVLGATGALAFSPSSPKSVLYHPVYNGSGQITDWKKVSGTYHCVTNPDRICTATFLNDDPTQQMQSSSPGNFTQP